ncbi:protein-(glutamine-N5) methyltransferase, release factor-specific [Comamonas serinivorans]|uniref:Release factor glutamine methyltransferase n=1 Tax=Comamonas serinivorans TaxID=1082851 RepID=A0A1Y0ETP7_9BURK|nr:peptide chain release factor N(5)-glutamine methyltransferase [Comamonas serinivorans]ARU06780.1 protein-(glutamine-N5) methyltransferase, release factor-specific [Comamonas serinivorans]
MTPLLDVAHALAQASQIGLARVDAQMLLLHVMGQPTHARAWLITHDDTPLSPDQAEHWQRLCAARLQGQPVAYLVGHKAFHGLQLQVDARVLDPRPDTEVLVDWALDVLRTRPGRPAPRVLDLGTGSGAIALAIAHAMAPASTPSTEPFAARAPDAPRAAPGPLDVEVTAVDASAEALAVARANAERLGLPVRLLHGSWYDALGDRHAGAEAAAKPPTPARFDCIVSNPPYIREDDVHLPALRHEPRQALTSGADGLDDIRTIVAGAPAWLARGGWLLLEHGWDQHEAVQALLRAAGFVDVQSRHDLADIPRCTGGRWPG